MTRIRKAVRAGAELFVVGETRDLGCPAIFLGDDRATLAALPATFREAERPAVLVESRNASTEVLAAVAALPLQREGWNGFNLLHADASRVGALDLGLVMPGGLAALASDPPDVLVLLGVDEIDLSPFARSFKLYLGSHGDRGAAAADVVLPAAAWLEKPGTFVNMEGRVQRGFRAVFPPGDAREDWAILRALAERLGVRLPYDDIAALRSRVSAQWPHLGAPGLAETSWVAPETASVAPPSGPTVTRAIGFYQANPILRASPTMAACVAEIVEGRRPALLEAAE